MRVTVETATPAVLDEVVDAAAVWQQDGMPLQLHPGDLGWRWRLGAEELAGNVRVWRGDGRIVAVGAIDDGELIRMALAPSVDEDDVLAIHLLADISDMACAASLAAIPVVEARFGVAFRELLRASGWVAGEPWTPLSRDLTHPVENCGLRVMVVTPRDAEDRVAVQRAAFTNSTFTVERWSTMAACLPYRRARCLAAYNAHDEAVAAVTVWSAGLGRQGLLEPMGVHPDHRRQGHGTAISVAAAAALREMGSSSAIVCTPSANAGAVATYSSAGFETLSEITDFRRPS